MKKSIVSILFLLALMLQSCENKEHRNEKADTQITAETKDVLVSENISQSEKNKSEGIVLGEDSSDINAYLKNIYKKNGKLYIDLDFVNFRYPTEGDYDVSDREIVNNNPKIRTYLIDDSTLIISNACKQIKSLELFENRNSILKNKRIITIGSSKNGKMQEINFGCYG